MVKLLLRILMKVQYLKYLYNKGGKYARVDRCIKRVHGTNNRR